RPARRRAPAWRATGRRPWGSRATSPPPWDGARSRAPRRRPRARPRCWEPARSPPPPPRPRGRSAPAARPGPPPTRRTTPPRRAFLPLPPREYTHWRMLTAYDDEHAVPPVEDVINFARWRRETMHV